jgi:hypothetical protein
MVKYPVLQTLADIYVSIPNVYHHLWSIKINIIILILLQMKQGNASILFTICSFIGPTLDALLTSDLLDRLI